MQNHTTMKTILVSRVKEGVNSWLSTGQQLLGILFFLLFGVGNVWGAETLHVRGYGGWSDSDANLMTGSSSPWTFTAYWETNGTFKISSTSQEWIGGPGAITVGAAAVNLTAGGGSDMYFNSIPTGGGIYTITVTKVNTTYKIQVTAVSVEQNSWKTITAPKIYWDNTNASYSNVAMLNGRVWDYGSTAKVGSNASKLTHITNTDLWYTTSISFSGDKQNFTTTLFVNGDWNTEETNVATKRAAYASSYTATNTATLNSNTYLFSAANGNKGATLNRSQLASGYSNLNHSQTVYKYTSSGGTTPGSYTAQSVNSGTITITAVKMKSASTANSTDNSATINTAATTSASKDAVYTGEVTLTASPNTGYSFVGWFESTSATTAISSETSYSYNAPNATKSIYARFLAEETHDVTVYYKYGSTTVKAQTTEAGVGVTTERSFSAPDVDGYNFFSYEFGSGLTMKSANTTTNPCRFVTKASGNYELTTNYNIAPVKMYYGNTSTFANSSYSSMTYDATKKAYYVDVTTNSKPYYFRFDFNTDTKELAGDWSDAGYPNVNEVTANGSKVACATDVKGWTYKSSLKFTGISGSSIRIWFSYKDKQAWITEATYTVTITNDGNGTTSPASVTAGKNTLSGSFSATANTGFYFKNWTKTSGSVTITNANTSPTTTKATEASTIRANFDPQWSVAGIGSWSTTTNKFSTAFYQESSKWKGDKTIVLAANTDYEIKAYDLKNSTWYGTNHSADYVHVYYANSGTAQSMSDTNGSAKNLQIHSAAGGSYTFKWNVTDKSMQIVYPTSWYITTGQKTTGQADNAGGSFTAVDNSSNNVYGGKFVANNATVTFVATPNTGFTFGGWYSNATCTTPYTAGGNISFSGEGNTTMVISSITDNTPVYAKFTPKTYTVTLTQTGAATTGTESVTATYNTTMPAIGSLPTAANGYCFMGYWDGEEGTGTKYYNANGTSAHAWNKTSGGTLYAYFKKAEITALTFDAAIVAPGTTMGVTPTISPTPTGTTAICWRVLHGNGNPLDDQPTFSSNPSSGEAKVTFPASTTSGTYLVEAILRKGTSCGGEVLDSVTAGFQVAGDHTVTVQYKCGNTTIKAPASVTGKPLQWTEITAPEIVGYSFSKWVEGDGITIEGATDGEKASATINFKAIYDGKLTAVYTQKRMIYFYNTLNWENVYVYFYKDGNYWDSSNGSGTDPSYYSGSHNSAHKGQMLPVTEGSKIYYFDAEEASIPAGYTNVAFTEKQQDNCWYFHDNNKVVRRGDYQSTTMPLFVPLSDQPAVSKNSGAATYYCEGYWMNYPANSGYTLRIYNAWNANNATGASREYMIPFSEDVKMPLKQEVEVNSSGESWFIIYRNDGTYLEGSHTFKQTDHGDKKITSNADASKAKKMRLISDGSGIYTFTLTFRGDGGSPENYDYYLNVDFPATVGDYRIVYSDNATWSNGAHGAGWYHPSDIIGKNTSETDAKEDTVSFFISHGSSPSMKFQYISAINGTTGAVTWTDVPSGSITIPTSITASGVYNFIVTQPAGGASISLEKAEPYTGNYYIRTDCAGETKWNNFRSPDHLITYSEYSITHGGYSHYYAHWVQTDDKKNIQFCIANDYSSAISDTLIRENNSDPAWANINNYIDVNGNILRNANVRFMWNQSTNKISRAYIDGAQGTGSDNFLKMLSSDSKIKDLSGTTKTEVYFQDNENWIYETNIQAQPNAQYKLVSNWGTSPVITQYFKGTSSSTETLITGSGSDFHVIRVIYDFKTNRIIAAWMPSGEYDDPRAINADVMFIREHQGDINQILLTDEGTITDIKTAYGVMRFNKWTINNKEKTGEHDPLASPASIYERSLYWVSFPFRVKLSEVFGFGTYGTHWILQYYDGAARAEKGMWAETGSYWKFIWDRKDFILEPNTGYLLTLETELMRPESSVWGPESRASQVELFFPSYGTMPNITQADVVTSLEKHTCTINRSGGNLPGGNDYRTTYDRRIVDSHWNVMGVPTYVNTDDVTFPASEWTTNLPKFLYTWNSDDNTITAASASGFTFHAMHAYMVQYYGKVTWSAHSGSPYPIVARSTYSEKPKEVEFCIELTQNETMLDRTFINLSDDEAVSAGFAFNEDMTKEFSGNKPAIYTFIDTDVVAAGNTLPMSDQKTIVPLGVETKQAGDYTIAIPNGTNGVGVTLIDEETGVHTSLSALDYTINLPAGKHDNRFFLEISPIKTTPTGIEDVQGDNVQSAKVHKVMIDGILYIVKDGKIFDARGARLR